jgi:hypothetical protein
MKRKGNQPTAMLVLLCVFAGTRPTRKTLKPSGSVSGLFKTELYTLYRVKERGVMEIQIAQLLQ